MRGGWVGGGWTYQQVHLEAFAAVTHCDLPWTLGTAGGSEGQGRGESQRGKEEERVCACLHSV